LARDEARFSPADAPEGAGDLSDGVMQRMDSQAEALSGRVQERRTEICGLRQAVERLDDLLSHSRPDYEQAQMAASSRDVAEGQLRRRLDEGLAEVARLRDGIASSKALLGEDGELGLAATQKEAEEAEASLRFESVADELARGEEDKEALMGDMSLAYQLAVTRQSEAQTRIRRMRAQRVDAKKAVKRARGQLVTVEEQISESRGRQAQLEGVLSQCRNALTVANERVTGDADRHAEDMRSLLAEEQVMRARGDKARRRTDALVGQLNGVRTEVSQRRRAIEDARDELRYNPALTEVAAVALVEAGQAAIDTSAQHLAHLEHASNLRATELTSHSHSTAAMRDPHRSSSSRVIGQAGHSVDIGVDIENESVQLRSQRVQDVVSKRGGRKQPSGSGVSVPLGLHVRDPAARTGRNRRSVKRETDPATTSSSDSSSSDADASTSLSISLDAADVVKGSALDHTFESASSMLSVSLANSEEDQMDLEITAIEDRIRARLASCSDNLQVR
jgi:chromosome segregation ATPase